MKVVSSGFSAHSILKEAVCFAYLLRFYDGICQWEEGSATPVLHIGWAKPLVNTISKFDAEVRARVHIVCDNSDMNEAKCILEFGQTQKDGKSKSGCLNNNYCDKKDANNGTEKELIKAIEIKVTQEQQDVGEQSTSGLHPSIEALAAACSEKILNPEYLLQGGGSPFVGSEEAQAQVRFCSIYL